MLISKGQRRAKFRTSAVLVVLALFLLPGPAFGQATIASIVGVVSDSSGAVLPGVTVIATSPALRRWLM
jgi:hypothetical protein